MTSYSYASYFYAIYSMGAVSGIDLLQHLILTLTSPRRVLHMQLCMSHIYQSIVYYSNYLHAKVRILSSNYHLTVCGLTADTVLFC